MAGSADRSAASSAARFTAGHLLTDAQRRLLGPRHAAPHRRDLSSSLLHPLQISCRLRRLDLRHDSLARPPVLHQEQLWSVLWQPVHHECHRCFGQQRPTSAHPAAVATPAPDSTAGVAKRHPPYRREHHRDLPDHSGLVSESCPCV